MLKSWISATLPLHWCLHLLLWVTKPIKTSTRHSSEIRFMLISVKKKDMLDKDKKDYRFSKMEKIRWHQHTINSIPAYQFQGKFVFNSMRFLNISYPPYLSLSSLMVKIWQAVPYCFKWSIKVLSPVTPLAHNFRTQQTRKKPSEWVKDSIRKSLTLSFPTCG